MPENIFNQILRRLSALENNQAKAIIEGEVIEIDEAKGLVRVDDGAGTVSDWVKVAGHKTKGITHYDFPEVGQSMIVQSNGQRSFAIYGGYSDKGKQNGTDNQVKRTDFDDGAYVEYNKSTGATKAVFMDNLDMTIGGIHIKFSGDTITVNGADIILPANDVIATLHSLMEHKHPGITPGPANTGNAIP